MTSFIPLTTVFTPPASCSDNSYTYVGEGTYVRDRKIESSECYPEGFSRIWAVSSPFSPGICPDSWNIGTYGVASWDPRNVEVALCCPNSMTLVDGDLGCYTSIDTQTVIALPTGTVTVQGVMLAARGVSIAWAQSDVSLFASSTDPSPSATTAVPSSTSAVSQNSDPTSVSIATVTTSVTSGTATIVLTIFPSTETTLTAKSHPTITSESTVNTSASSPTTTHHAPSRTIVGISVGAVVAVAALAGLIAITILKRRRRRRKQAKTDSNPVDARVFETASEFNEDKRNKLLRFYPLSPSSPQFSDATSHQSPALGSEKHGLGILEVQEADSRCVRGEVAELE